MDHICANQRVPSVDMTIAIGPEVKEMDESIGMLNAAPGYISTIQSMHDLFGRVAAQTDRGPPQE